MAAATGLILLDRDGVLNAMVPNPAEPRPDSPLRTSEVVVFDWVPDVLRDADAGRFRHRHRQQPAGVGEGQDHPRRSAGRPRRDRPRGDREGGRHPQLAHLLSPRGGRLHLPEARDGAARRGVRAASRLRSRVVVDGRRSGVGHHRRGRVRVADGSGRRRRGRGSRDARRARADADVRGSRSARPGGAPAPLTRPAPRGQGFSSARTGGPNGRTAPGCGARTSDRIPARPAAARSRW